MASEFIIINKSCMKSITPLPSFSSNLSLPLQQLPTLMPFLSSYKLLHKGTFYPYNHQYNDFGWGCAWRAIQLILSVSENGQESDFKELVQYYRSRDKLMVILAKNGQDGLVAGKSGWAPQENHNCWAEPFIGSIICADHQLQTKLLLVNGYPKAYAPQSVFSSTIAFPQFCSLLSQYLPQWPIMIDDGLLALTIIGYKAQQNTHHIVLADPHISANTTLPDFIHLNENQVSKERMQKLGIYVVVLDQNGKWIKSSVEEDEQQYYPMDSFQQIHFWDKKWMVLIVTGKKQ